MARMVPQVQMGKLVCPAHCLYSSSSTLMTLVGIEGRGCCNTSEPNHFARPTGELLLWLVRCSSWECMWGRPDLLGTLGGVWTLIAAAWEPEPGGCRTMERKVSPGAVSKETAHTPPISIFTDLIRGPFGYFQILLIVFCYNSFLLLSGVGCLLKINK